MSLRCLCLSLQPRNRSALIPSQVFYRFFAPIITFDETDSGKHSFGVLFDDLAAMETLELSELPVPEEVQIPPPP